MKKMIKQACFMAVIVAAFSIMTSAFVKSGETTYKFKSMAEKSEPYAPKQVTWEVTSDSDAKVALVSMALSKVIPVKPGFSLVVVNEGYTATDVGPYNRLFLVYHSQHEMPHYEATFFLGKVHSVNSVKYMGKNSIQIEVLLHSRIGQARVHLIVDVTKLNTVMDTPPKAEGNLSVTVKITASEIPKFSTPNKALQRTSR